MDDLKTFLQEGGTPVISVRDDIQGKTLLASGGFGKVSSGVLKSDGTKVVIKEMLSDGARFVKLFKKEIKFLSTTRHPNVVRMRAVCLQPLCPVMEYVSFDLARLGTQKFAGLPKGHNLGELLDILADRELVESLGIARGILQKAALDVAVGLAFLHSKDICHRDMKPANVLVANDGSTLLCKLTDFGEARSLLIQTDTALYDVTERLKRGTLPFCAPEQLLGETHAVDMEGLKKIDVWAFGMILFCLLNPDLKIPWQLEFGFPPKIPNLFNALNARRPPSHSATYQHVLSRTGLLEMYTRCVHFTPQDRPDMNTIKVELLRQISTAASRRGLGQAAARDSAARGCPRAEQADPSDRVARLYLSDTSGPVSVRASSCYEDLKLKSRLGDSVDGPAHMVRPQGLCWARQHLIVTERPTMRLVVFQEGSKRYQFVSDMAIDQPLFCAAHPKTGRIYVTCSENSLILELEFGADPPGQLRVVRTLIAGGNLNNPRGLCFGGIDHDETLFVACHTGVHKISIVEDKVLSTLWHPAGQVKGPSDRIASCGNSLLVSHSKDKLLVLYETEDAMGRVIHPRGVTNPRAVHSDASNFLVGDRDNKCMFVISPEGALVARVGTGDIEPFEISSRQGEIYFVGYGGSHVYVLA